jgi:sulfate transport system permease protein
LDLPLSVSPVVAGLLFVLLLGSHGWWGAWLEQHGLQMLFAWPAIVLATLFVTLPMVAREVLPLLQSVGAEADWAAVTLGASGWQLLWRVILPQVRWAILYGVLLTSSRALGEFGAVSVVSGHIRGETNTLPLHIEVLYAEYHTQQAFAVASLLVFYGLLTLALRRLIATRLPEGVRNGH